MKAILNILLKLLVIAGLLFYLISQVTLNDFEDEFSETAPLFFLLAVGFFVISNGLGACQWYFLLRAQKLQIKFGQAMIAYWIGVFFNNVLLGNIGGDALRIYDVQRLTGDLRGAAAATFMDRLIGLFATCSLALAALFIVDTIRESGIVSVIAPVWLGLIALFAMGLSKRIGNFLDSIIAQILPFRIGRLVCKLRRSIFVYRHKSLVLLGVLSMSLTVQFARILVYWAAGLAVGLQISLIYFIGFQPVAAVISALPISIGGLGIRENIFVELFSRTDVSESAVLAMSLLGYTAGIIASLLGALAFVARRIKKFGPSIQNKEKSGAIEDGN